MNNKEDISFKLFVIRLLKFIGLLFLVTILFLLLTWLLAFSSYHVVECIESLKLQENKIFIASIIIWFFVLVHYIRIIEIIDKKFNS